MRTTDENQLLNSRSSEAKSASKTVLTAEIRYSKKLSSTEKILFAEISGLAKKQKKCWATNTYFANKFGLSNKTISRCITNLQKQGLITVQIDQAAGNKRLIFISEDTPEMSIPMDNSAGSSGQKDPQKSDSLLIYENNKERNSESNKRPLSDFFQGDFKNYNLTCSIPKAEEVESYMLTLDYPGVRKIDKDEAQAFFDYYQALGWKMKGGPIADWQAAARNWLNKSQTFNTQNNESSRKTSASNYQMGHASRLSSDRNKEYAGSL